MDRIVRFSNWDCHVKLEKYSQYNNDAIILVDVRDGLPVITATVNLKGLKEDEVAIKNNDVHAGMLDVLVEAGVVSPPIRHDNSGYFPIPICKILI